MTKDTNQNSQSQVKGILWIDLLCYILYVGYFIDDSSSRQMMAGLGSYVAAFPVFGFLGLVNLIIFFRLFLQKKTPRKQLIILVFITIFFITVIPVFFSVLILTAPLHWFGYLSG